MAGRDVKVEIEAEDRATRVLERLNKRIERMQAPAQRTQRALARFGQLTGLNQVGTGFRRLEGYAQGVFSTVGRILPIMGTLTGAASVAGVVRLATAWAGFGSRLGFSAQRIGVSAGQLQTLDGAARLAGASSGSLESGMQALGQGMWDAVGGRAPEMVSTFRALRVEWQKGDGSAKSVAEMMPVLADKIAGIRNPYAQAAVASRLFGGAAEDLLPFLRLGSAGMARYAETARRYGVMNDKGVAAAGRLRFAQAELTLAVEGLGNSIAEELEPVLGPIIHQMAEWISHNRKWIASKIHEYVKRFADYIKSIDWKAVETGAQAIWGRIDAVAQRLGGWQSAGKDALVALGLLYGASVLSGFGRLAGSLSSIVGLLGMIPGARLVTISLVFSEAMHELLKRQLASAMPNASDDDRARTQLSIESGGVALPDAPADAGAENGGWGKLGSLFGGTSKANLAAAPALFGGLEAANGLPSGMLDRLWDDESSRGANMRSGKGALGHFGFMPGTAAQYGVADPNDLSQSANGASRYIRDLSRRYGGDTRKAIAAYNWGPGNLDNDIARWGGDWLAHAPAETQGEVAYVADGQRPSPMQDKRGFWHRAGEDISDIFGARGGPATIAAPASAPAAVVPPGTVQSAANDAAFEKLKAELHVTIRSAPGTTASVRSSGSGGMRVASVQTQRAMDPAMTPGGY